MADFDFEHFAQAFDDRLAALGYSLTDAERKWPGTDRAMLSRATNGKTLSAGNLLFLCEMAGLDPFAFLDRGKGRRVTLKTLRKQAVTRCVARETQAQDGGSPCTRQDG